MDQIRLTNFIRQTALDALIAKRFGAEEKAIKQEKLEMGTRVYKAAYPEWEKMMALPKGWMSDFGSFSVRINGERHHLRTSEEIRLPTSDKERQMPKDLVKPYRELLRKEELFEAQRDSAYDQARATLWSVSTLKRLLEVWPDVAPYLPKDLTAKTTAIALPIPQLNAMFGLGGAK